MLAYMWLRREAVEPELGETWSTEEWVRMTQPRPLRLTLLALTGFGKPRKRAYAVQAQTLAEFSSPLPAGDSFRPIEGQIEKAIGNSLDDELWEVELKGRIHRWGTSVMLPPSGPTARQGRLVRRVDSWSDELAAELAREWIFAARDELAGAMRAEAEANSDSSVRQARLGRAERLAGAETRKEIESVAKDLSRRHDLAGLTIFWEAALRALWLAARFVQTKSPQVAAGKAAEARAAAAGAQVWGRAAKAVAGEQDLFALLDVQDAAAVEAARERRRLGEELRARLGLPAPDPAAQKVPLRVAFPFLARLLVQFLIGFGFVFVLLGPALTLDDSLEVEALSAAGISAAGLGLIALALLLLFGSRAVSAMRWSRRLDQLYGEPSQAANVPHTPA